MRILTGIDIVDIHRVGRMVQKHSPNRLGMVFTAAEIRYCSSFSRNAAEKYAARFAAKEAMLKTLGRGLFQGVALKDIEVVLLDSGKPAIRLHGSAEKAAERLAIVSLDLSISHSRSQAVAVVVALCDPNI